MLKNNMTYEIMKPEDVGVPSSAIVLTSRSGRAALRHRLQLIGFDFEGGIFFCKTLQGKTHFFLIGFSLRLYRN